MTTATWTLHSPALAPAPSMTRAISPEALYKTHGPMVYRRALKILRDPAEAEEALQEVFVRVLRNKDSFRAKSQVTTWLYSITTHYCLNRLRNSKRRRQLYDERVAPALSDTTIPSVDAELWARKALAAADPKQAEAAVYVHIDGMSHREAAEVMGVSKRTVGNLLERFAASVTKDEGES
ncbi:MAG: RNA polymerase sigma factor [Myxococcota bacterium]